MNLNLNKKIYTKAGIKSTIEAFGEVCNVEMDTKGEYYHLSFHDVDESVKDSLIDEFANYALYGTLAGKKTW